MTQTPTSPAAPSSGDAPAPDTPAPAAAPPPRLPSRALRVFRGVLLGLVRGVLVLALFLGLLVVYLTLVGLPRPILDDLLDRLAEQGWHLRVSRVRLSVDRGILATGVELYESPDAPAPLLTADALSADTSPFLLFRHATLAPTLELTGGRVSLDFGAASGAPPRTLVADRISIRFSARSGELLVRDASARCLGIHFRGHGAVYIDPTAPSSGTDPADLFREVLDALADLPEPALQAIDALNSIRFAAPPDARFSFTLYPDHPEANAFAFRLLAPEGLAVHGVSFDRFEADAAWRDARLAPVRAVFSSGDRAFRASGSWDASSNIVSAALSNDLPPATFLPALPDDLRARIAASLAPLDFPLAIDASLGPADPDTLADTLRVSLRASDFTACGIPVQSLDASLRRDGPRWTVPSASLVALRDGVPCALAVSNAAYDAASTAFSARLSGTVWPDLLLRVPDIPEDSIVRDILSRFAFSKPAEASARLAGTLQPFDFVLRGPATIREGTLHGVPFDTAEALVSVTPTNFVATAAKLTRPEGLARGDVSFSFPDLILRLDVDSTCDPRAVCDILGPEVSAFAAPFALEGPCHASLAGALDFHNFSRTSLRGHAEGERLGFGPWVADTASGDVAVRGLRVEVSNVVASIWGGSLSGDASFFPLPAADTWHFEVAADASSLSLADFLSVTFHDSPPNLRGSVSIAGHLSGDFSPDPLSTLSGHLRTSVAHGLLFQTRIFSGLSSMLQYIIPGFDWFAQTDASATATIREGTLRTEDASVAGPLFGITAKGSASADRSLDFQVEVKLLHRGILASIVQIATLPVTRLLKFRLSGSFDDPHWSPVNLNPAKLLRIGTPSGSSAPDATPARPAAPLPVPTS